MCPQSEMMMPKPIYIYKYRFFIEKERQKQWDKKANAISDVMWCETTHWIGNELENSIQISISTEEK